MKRFKRRLPGQKEEIIEVSDKCYCESCLNKHRLGMNRLGNILMEVREAL